MINIMLVCAGGMSTSLLMNKIKEAARNKSIEVNVWATSQGDAKNHYDKSDCVLVGPQIRFAIPKMEQEIAGRCPIKGIEMKDYGAMDGAKVLDLALSLTESFEK